MYRLIYRPRPGEGPETKTIKGGFDITVTPNKALETKDPVLALALVDRVKQIQPVDKAMAAKLEAARAKLKAAAKAKAAAAAAAQEAIDQEAPESLDSPEAETEEGAQ